MLRLSLLSLLLISLCSGNVAAQRSPPANGPQIAKETWHALVGGTVICEPGRELPGATLVLRGERIVAVLPPDQSPPTGARTHDMTGLTLYAAFVDAHLRIEVEDRDGTAATDHWNANVRPERSVLAQGDIPHSAAEELRELGFGAACIAPSDGVFRGYSELVSLENLPSGKTRRPLDAGEFDIIGFASRGARDQYPRSLMGAIALIRQTLIDAAGEGSDLPELNDRTPSYVQALHNGRRLAFDARDELESLRAAKIAAEFGKNAVLIGSGREFRRLDAIATCGLPIILPLNFPAAPDVDTLDSREAVSLRDLLTWEHAPTNMRRLLDAGVVIVLTTDRLQDRAQFSSRLRRAMRFGITHDDALAALTTAPATLLDAAESVGRLAPGLLANVLVMDGRLGDEEATVRTVWIRGIRHEIERAPQVALEGSWQAALQVGGAQVDQIDFSDDVPTSDSVIVRAGESEVHARRVSVRGRQLDLTFDATELGGNGITTLHAMVNGERMIGSGVDARGRRFGWSARHRAADVVTAAEASTSTEPDEVEPDDGTASEGDAEDDPGLSEPRLDLDLPVPFGAFGITGAIPASEDILIRNATVWTSAAAGIIEQASVWIRDGRIAWIGSDANLPANALTTASILDATHLHLTPGLIDCHSHTGISKGINEGTQAVTAEVRIGDVINPDDINWYRQLAGGVTTVNQLHGSANPIGGQNSVVKIRWGVRSPDAMKFAGAPTGIKFALGENVKQANWGDKYTERYPQTRMGVEALIRERFLAARDYEASRARGESVARDLELEALAEVLRGERLVHCHSYRQDEILMLCRIAREFDFTIGTFQHGLECYKVAEALRGVSRGASVFTDRWAYKFEVLDAIPENAAILHEQRVLVSFNSDSNELARRLNTEAAKAVKYGEVDPATALKFVTLHPAMQLGIDHRVGSLEIGKDADIAIWNGDPLSTLTRCLATLVDGRRYWSAETDRTARVEAAAERERLIQIVLALDDSERAGEPSDSRSTRGASGVDNLPGDCGCCDRGAAMGENR